LLSQSGGIAAVGFEGELLLGLDSEDLAADRMPSAEAPQQPVIETAGLEDC
jgi:hypothetical protein